MTPRNRILAALPADERERLASRMELVALELREVLIDPNREIADVYFVEDGVVSILGVMADGSAVETATVGHEGMVGLPVFLGASSVAAQAFAQVPGRAYRLSAAALREEIGRGGALAALLGRYTQALFTLVAQSSACNRLHPVGQRCARWLLMTHDRAGRDTFELTHLFLSQMLGVRRATVTEAAGELQRRGLIDYTRGKITVIDRAGLERASCECYGVITAEFVRLLDGDGGRAASPLEGVAVSEDGKTTVGEGAPRDGARIGAPA